MMALVDYRAMYQDWCNHLEKLKAMSKLDLLERHQTEIEGYEHKVKNLQKKLEQLGDKFD